MSELLKGRTIFEGKCFGKAIVSDKEISFLGSVDPDTGKVIQKDNILFGKNISGKILVFPNAVGSTVGSYSLYRLKKNNVAPKALVCKEAETIVAVGSIISEIPCVDKIDISKIKNDDYLFVDANSGTIKKIPEIKCIIFDLDGTIVDTVGHYINSYLSVVKNMGSKVDEKVLLTLLGKPAESIFEMYFKKYRPKNKKIDLKKCCDLKRKLFIKAVQGKDVAFPYAKETLQELSKSFKLAMFTGSSRDHVRLDKKTISLFDIIFAGKECPKDKPSPATIFLIAKKLNIKPESCIYIGDLPIDMKTAKNAKIMAIGLENNFTDAKKLSKGGADIIVKNYFNIQRLFL